MTSRTRFIPTKVVSGKPKLDVLKAQYIGLSTSGIGYQNYVLTQSEEGCPDLIAWNVYQDEQYYWIILQFNRIINPLTELMTGMVLRIPDLSEALAYIRSNQPHTAAVNSNRSTVL